VIQFTIDAKKRPTLGRDGRTSGILALGGNEPIA